MTGGLDPFVELGDCVLFVIRETKGAYTADQIMDLPYDAFWALYRACRRLHAQGWFIYTQSTERAVAAAHGHLGKGKNNEKNFWKYLTGFLNDFNLDRKKAATKKQEAARLNSLGGGF